MIRQIIAFTVISSVHCHGLEVPVDKGLEYQRYLEQYSVNSKLHTPTNDRLPLSYTTDIKRHIYTHTQKIERENKRAQKLIDSRRHGIEIKPKIHHTAYLKEKAARQQADKKRLLERLKHQGPSERINTIVIKLTVILICSFAAIFVLIMMQMRIWKKKQAALSQPNIYHQNDLS